MKVHLALFTFGCLSLATLGWLQGTDTPTTTVGLDWAHMLMLLWAPILAAHAFAFWFGIEIDDLDDDTAKRLVGRWFGGFGG